MARQNEIFTEEKNITKPREDLMKVVEETNQEVTEALAEKHGSVVIGRKRYKNIAN